MLLGLTGFSRPRLSRAISFKDAFNKQLGNIRPSSYYSMIGPVAQLSHSLQSARFPYYVRSPMWRRPAQLGFWK